MQKMQRVNGLGTPGKIFTRW